MGRSQSFASASTDYDALFGLAFAPAARLKALNLASEEQLVGSLCKRHAVTPKGSDSLQAHGFRFFFTPLLTVLFTFPSRYWSTIGLLVVFSLGGWCRRIQAGFLRSRPTQDLPLPINSFRLQDYHLLRSRFPAPFCYDFIMICGSYNPEAAVTAPVWALPLSLATTRGITIVFSSSAYLDVSVQQVRLLVRGCQAFSLTGCPIRKSGYQNLFAVTPGLSQLVTSFFASRSLGIPRAPLVTLPNLNDITFLNARSLVSYLVARYSSIS